MEEASHKDHTRRYFSGEERSSFPWNLSEDRGCQQWQFPWNSRAFGTLRSTVAGKSMSQKFNYQNRRRNVCKPTTYVLIHITNLLLCADYVRKCILEELNQAKYYSIMVDATPNASYTEQTIFVLRYLLEETGEFMIKERFLTFVDSRHAVVIP